MAADTQAAAADTGTNVAAVPTCNMCHLPKPGPLCLHCDQPCSVWRLCPACKAGDRYDGIGPKTGPWRFPRYGA